MLPGSLLTVTIDKPAAGGRMIARHEGQVLLVAGGIPGEVVEVTVEKVQRGTVWAAVARVLEPSPDRVEVGPDWACGGSVYAHIAYERQRALKAAIVHDAFARVARLPLELPFDVTGSPIDGYRIRARLHVRNGRIGFFREGSHDLCDARATGQLSERTGTLVAALEQAVAGVAQARVTEVELAENIPGTETACHLDLVPGGDPSRLAEALMPLGLRGASCASGPDARALVLHGDACVTDVLKVTTRGGTTAEARLSRHARSFFQGNRFLIGGLTRKVTEAVPDGPVVDLYAGVGLFAVTRAALGGVSVTAVEGDRWAGDDLRQNAAPFPDAIRVYRQPVEQLPASLPEANTMTVIVDPPRTGMSREATRLVIGWRAARIVYVSCDVATLARDARIIVDAGYRITDASGFDLFPNTAHVETVIVFERTTGSGVLRV